jgi:hypothetical protein
MKEFIIGFLFGVLVILLWRRVSGYEAASVFSSATTMAQAQKIYDDEMARLMTAANSAMEGTTDKAAAEKMAAELKDNIAALSAEFIKVSGKFPPEPAPPAAPAAPEPPKA